jgi:hypothetical protein
VNWVVHVVVLAAMAIAWFVFAAEHAGESGINSLGTGILVGILAVAGMVHAAVSTIALSFCAHRRFAAPLVHLAILLVVVVGGFFAFFTPVAPS